MNIWIVFADFNNFDYTPRILGAYDNAADAERHRELAENENFRYFSQDADDWAWLNRYDTVDYQKSDTVYSVVETAVKSYLPDFD